MQEVVRLIDGDPASLDARIARTLERVGGDWRVARFTYWYTGRPPIHEALVVRPPAPSQARDGLRSQSGEAIAPDRARRRARITRAAAASTAAASAPCDSASAAPANERWNP
jgi:hypothetical protein